LAKLLTTIPPLPVPAVFPAIVLFVTNEVMEVTKGSMKMPPPVVPAEFPNKVLLVADTAP